MKYIRTKNKIEVVETKLDNKELFDYLKQFDNYKDYLIKVADTILELLDGFIVCEKGNKKNWFVADVDEIANEELEELQYSLKNWTYNGFIQTDKGLIYVAKMNKEGQLELL